MNSGLTANRTSSLHTACLRPRQLCSSTRAVRLVVRAEKKTSKWALDIPSILKPVVFAAASNVILANPALAAGGKIFDFGPTLPVMAGQFLLLMVFLEKQWFTPVGKMLDERDVMIREKLASVGDNTSEIAKLEDDATAIIKAARSEAQEAIAQSRKEVQATMTVKFDAAKMEVDKELESAFEELEKEKEETMNSLDDQIDRMGANVLARVLPKGVALKK